MSYGNIRARPDLSPLFGPLKKQDNDRILDLLLQIDDRLSALAQAASQHVGVPYRHTGLGLFAGVAGAEIAGGPSGETGDIWFEIQKTFDENTRQSHAPPWIVDSQIIVFCVDHQTDNHSNCTHVLAGIVNDTLTPISAVETLAAHVDRLTAEFLNRRGSEFTESLHAALVILSGGRTG